VNRNNYIEYLALVSDYMLYKLTKLLFIQQFRSVEYNKWKLKLIVEECKKRNLKILDDAINDSSITVASIQENELFNNKILDIQRIDHLSKLELKRFVSSNLTKGNFLMEDIILEEKQKKIFSLLGSSNIFFLITDGNSMKDVGIIDGSLLLADKGKSPNDESIVICTVSGETLVKQYRSGNGKIWLESKNKNFPNINIENEDFDVLGTVRMSINFYD
jgi:hypothetical protein